PPMPTRIAPLFAAISIPRPCRCFAKDRDSETPGLGARGSWIGARREFLLQARDVLKQPAAGQLEKAEPELRVLEIQLLKPIVAQRLHVAGLAADERLRAPAVRGEEAKFADHRPGRYVHAGFAQAKWPESTRYIASATSPFRNRTSPVLMCRRDMK